MKIIIADDHPLFRGALRQTLADLTFGGKGNIVLLDSVDIDSTHKLLKEHDDCDLLLLDLHMPGAQGFSGLVNLRGCFPFVPVAVVSGSDAPYIVQNAKELGASGFIPKSTSPEEIRTAIAALLAGEVWFPALKNHIPNIRDTKLADVAEKIAQLTPHQFRVFSMINRGLLNKQIAYELGISETTVKSHIKMIFRKLDVGKRTEIIILANALQVEMPDAELSRA